MQSAAVEGLKTYISQGYTPAIHFPSNSVYLRQQRNASAAMWSIEQLFDNFWMALGQLQPYRTVPVGTYYVTVYGTVRYGTVRYGTVLT